MDIYSGLEISSILLEQDKKMASMDIPKLKSFWS